MTYDETLEYLYHKLPMFSRIGEAAIKKDLNNTIVLCASLNNPQNTFKTIHIAGTNGKGSTDQLREFGTPSASNSALMLLDVSIPTSLGRRAITPNCKTETGRDIAS